MYHFTASLALITKTGGRLTMKHLSIVLILSIVLMSASAFGQGNVTATGTDLAPTFSPGTSKPIVRLSFSSISLLPKIASVKVTRTGTATNTDVPTAKLYRDVNQNDIVDGGDVQIGGTQTFASGSVTFSSLSYSPSTTENLLIIYDVAAAANTSNTAGATVGSADITGEALTTVTFSGGINTANQTLPVQFVSFTASANRLTVELHWTTATEVHNYGFEIERQQIRNSNFEIRNWEKVGFVQGAGTSNAPHEYTFVDKVSAPAAMPTASSKSIATGRSSIIPRSK